MIACERRETLGMRIDTKITCAHVLERYMNDNFKRKQDLNRWFISNG